MILFLLNLALGVLVLIFWLFAALSLGSVAYMRKHQAVKVAFWTGAVWGLLGAIALAAKIAVSVNMSQTSGAWYGQLTFTVVLPIVLPALVAVGWLTVPRLWRLLRSNDTKTEEAVQKRSEPAFIVPVQLAACSALLAVLAVFEVRTLKYWLTVLICWLILASVGWLLYWRRQRMAVQASQAGAKTPRMRLFAARALGAVLAFFLLIGTAAFFDMLHSRLPASYDMATMQGTDMHGVHHPSSSPAKDVSIATLTEKDLNGPVIHYDLTAQEKEITLSSGKKIKALTFNGQVPGPRIVAREGDILEVTLKNELADHNASLHWHGLDVPNAEDGVPGLTQDAVRFGKSHTYRFKLKQTGTFWYHSHQQSSEQVKKGLYGPLTILPKDDQPDETDIELAYHEWDGAASLNLADTLQKQKLAPGTKVRLRVVNTSNSSTSFVLHGAPFAVAAIDGNAVVEPTQLTDVRVRVPAGGKRDLTFTMPESAVFFGKASDGAFQPKELGTTWSPDGTQGAMAVPAGPELDLLTYGKPQQTAISAQTDFDRTYTQYFDPRVGFFDGKFSISYAINGALYPDTPMVMVHEGNKVKVTFYNRTPQTHPMHLHGHQMLVLSRNGVLSTGSPWWTDTLDVRPGESYQVAFVANNPGLWMDHCHDLEHAAGGMIMHVMYAGYTTPYRAGSATGNTAE